MFLATAMHLYLIQLLLHHISSCDIIMKFIDTIKGWLSPSQDDEGLNVALAGIEAHTQPLSTQHITYMFCKVTNLLTAQYLTLFSEELNVADSVVVEGIRMMTRDINPNLTCCVEYPYIDEVYRDTYYNFYSRKHGNHGRYCFRISFFHEEVTEDNFYETATDSSYLGYIVLRPTPRRVVGYSFLSPFVYPEPNFSICLCRRSSSIMGKILIVSGFPFCGQDGELCTCAETSIVVVLDYFSRRYNRYQRVLPSVIVNFNSDNNLQKLQPSSGIDMDEIVLSFNSISMATRKFQRQDQENAADNRTIFEDDVFEKLLHIYVESGFPLLVSEGEHAYLVIGREDKLFPRNPHLITINDNGRPYELCEDEHRIVSFIVPQSDNILLDADKINVTAVLNDFQRLYNQIDFGVNDEEYYNRVFLTTSRSFKQYIVSSSLERTDKDLIICTAMPRFIWVCESIRNVDVTDNISQVNVTVTSVLDATEYAHGHSHLLMVIGARKLIVPEEDGIRSNHRIYVVYETAGQLHPFNNNLKGSHNQWQI